MAVSKDILLRVAKWHEAHGSEKKGWFFREKNNYWRLQYQRDYERHFRIAHELRVQAYGSAQ